MAMSFADEMNPAWENGFKPGILDTEFFEPVRVKDIEHAGKIDNLAMSAINASNMAPTLSAICSPNEAPLAAASKTLA